MNCSGLLKFCQPNRCENGGTCVPLMDAFLCECSAGYKGKTCGELVNKCDSNPCRNEGTCTTTSSEYKCACTKAYEGDNCEKEVDFCKDKKICENEGVCVSQTRFANFTCNCTSNYMGTRCEILKDVGRPDQRTANSDQTDIIIGVAVACILLILLVIIIVIYKKRSANGTYSPSKQELDGGRVELNSVLKPPNLERLI